MAKERYIKIGNEYFPIDGTYWEVTSEGYVHGYVDTLLEGSTITLKGKDALNLTNLLDALSLDVSLLKEEEHNG